MTIRVLISALMIVVVCICVKFINFNNENSIAYLFAIASGILAFLIPLIWNFYKSIIDLQKNIKITEDGSENILVRCVYKDRYDKFEKYILFPIFILSFLSLFMAPFYGFAFGYVFLGTMFIYVLWLPWIYGEVERRSAKNLKDLILSEQLVFEDYKKIMQELWSNSDEKNEKEALILPVELFKSLSNRIDKIFIDDISRLKEIFVLLDDFNNFLEKRIIVLLLIKPSFFSKILDWHFKFWEKEYTYLNKEDLNKEDELDLFGAYSDISGKLDDIVIGILKRTLDEGHAYVFFKHLKVHLSLYEKKIIDKYSYLENIPIYEELFENVENSKESYSIWEHYYPKEWKITISNLKVNITSRFWFDKFFNWARYRIGDGSTEFDKALDGVVRGLFPEINPIKWSLILAYFSISWGNSRMEALIEWKRNFGFSSNVFVMWETDDGKKEFKKHIIEEDEKTYELAAFIFKDWFKDEISNNIIELNKLQYEKNTKKDNRRKELLTIFEGIKKYL